MIYLSIFWLNLYKRTHPHHQNIQGTPETHLYVNYSATMAKWRIYDAKTKEKQEKKTKKIPNLYATYVAQVDTFIALTNMPKQLMCRYTSAFDHLF